MHKCNVNVNTGLNQSSRIVCDYFLSIYKNRDVTEVVCDTTVYVTRMNAVVSLDTSIQRYDFLIKNFKVKSLFFLNETLAFMTCLQS